MNTPSTDKAERPAEYYMSNVGVVSAKHSRQWEAIARRLAEAARNNPESCECFAGEYVMHVAGECPRCKALADFNQLAKP